MARGELAWLIHEPHTGLEDCLNMLLSCLRKRMSGGWRVLCTHPNPTPLRQGRTRGLISSASGQPKGIHFGFRAKLLISVLSSRKVRGPFSISCCHPRHGKTRRATHDSRNSAAWSTDFPRGRYVLKHFGKIGLFGKKEVFVERTHFGKKYPSFGERYLLLAAFL